jgi:hypothetical protein
VFKIICSVDVETQGLNASKFLTGCLIRSDMPDKPEIYDNKNLLWGRILQLGMMEARKGHTLSVYAHNHSYDFYAYANLKDPNIKWFCHQPFIQGYTAEVKGKQREIIKFLDTYAIYKMSLARMAELNGMKKYETPEKLKSDEKNVYNKNELTEINYYMAQDARIVLNTIIGLKKKLFEEGIKVKRLYTINQIAINSLINYWKKNPDYNHLFWNKNKNELRRTLRWEQIKGAYRGGRVQAIKTGHYNNVTTIDINSLYPWACTKIKFPDLASERMTWKPKDLNEEIGIARILIKNVNNKIGILPIRTPNGSYYPTKGKYLIGTWTHREIKKAISEGYKLISTEWKVTYKEATNNPLKNYMNEMYKKRKESKTKHDDWFYKQLMNSALGKFGQRRNEEETIIDDIEKSTEYLKRGYKMIKGIDMNIMYKKTLNTEKRKGFFCPIIPTIVNAEARIRLYDEMKKIPQKDLLYVDTDSLTLKNYLTHKDKFSVGVGLGEFKKEQSNVDCEIKTKKTYRIGNTVKISGIHHHAGILEEFKTGMVNDTKMVTIKQTNNTEEMGRFKTKVRDLNEQQEKHLKNMELLNKQEIYLDEEINDISYFLPIINEIIDL